MDALQFDHISFSYGARRFSLSDISLSLPQGSFGCVVGANGAGKTTLFRLACNILTPTAGHIRVSNQALSSYSRASLARHVAFVPQQGVPAIGMRVEEFVLLGRVPYARGVGFTTADDLQRAADAMRVTDCLEFKSTWLGELSGGELQRVLVARALAQDPALLLLDEPNSHLDVAHQLALFQSLRRWQHGTNRTVLASTHDLNLASMFATHVIVLHDGALAACGAPADVFSEALVERVFRVRTDVVAGYYGSAPAVHLRVQ